MLTAAPTMVNRHGEFVFLIHIHYLAMQNISPSVKTPKSPFSKNEDFKANELRKKYEQLIAEGNKQPELIDESLHKIRELVLLEGLPPETEVTAIDIN